MQHKKKTLRLVSKTVMVVCNMCGEALKPENYTDNYVSIKKTWGYGSPYDGETHSFELCGKCYDELLSRLKIEPTKN